MRSMQPLIRELGLLLRVGEAGEKLEVREAVHTFIIDIGIAPEREDRSPFYMAELEETAGYPLLMRMPLP